jgi:hypothetical protein
LSEAESQKSSDRISVVRSEEAKASKRLSPKKQETKVVMFASTPAQKVISEKEAGPVATAKLTQFKPLIVAGNQPKFASKLKSTPDIFG